MLKDVLFQINSLSTLFLDSFYYYCTAWVVFRGRNGSHRSTKMESYIHQNLCNITTKHRFCQQRLDSNGVVTILEFEYVTQGFLTPDSFHSTSLATWGSSWESKEAKFIKEFDFLGFSHCFSVKIE